jgi:hypothetical protein
MLHRSMVACGASVFLLAGCASEPLYLTSSKDAGDQGAPAPGSYVFIGPYFTNARTRVIVTITQAQDKASAPGGGAKPDGMTGDDAKAPVTTNKTIEASTTDESQTRKTGTAGVSTHVTRTTQSTSTTEISTSGNNPPDPQNGKSAPTTIALTFLPEPTERGFLYLKKNWLFDSTISMSLDNGGFISQSDSSSTQEVTAILTELAQTAQGAMSHGFAPGALLSDPENLKICRSAVSSLAVGGTYTNAITLKFSGTPISGGDDNQFYVDEQNIVIKGLLGRAGAEKDSKTGSVDLVILYRRLIATASDHRDIANGGDGIVVFYPTPLRVVLACRTDGRFYYLTAEQMINIYTDRSTISPQRDFFTNPHDVLSFNAGFITGHKYSEQSSAKTVVDTVTAPIRAVFPGVSINNTNTTTVVTSDGKPTQTTNTTTTTTSSAPPK